MRKKVHHEDRGEEHEELPACQTVYGHEDETSYAETDEEKTE